MKVRYRTNWQGPVSLDWYRQRGLTQPECINILGQCIETTRITKSYSCGCIDVSCGVEITIPLMLTQDWYQFTRWLRTLETDDIWTLDQLCSLYERTNKPIEWYEPHIT